MNVDCLSIFLAYKLAIYIRELFFARHCKPRIYSLINFFARHFFSQLVDEIKLLHKFWAGMICTIERGIVLYLLNERFETYKLLRISSLVNMLDS